MNDNENRRYQTFLRVQDFGEARTADFAVNSLGKQHFTTLAGIVTELAGHSASKASGFGLARQGTTTRRQARDELIEDLRAISRTAAVMASDVPGLADKFRLPRGRINDQNLLALARAFAVDAAPLAAQFIAHELRSDFLEDLAADIAALEAAISRQSSGVGDHVAANAAIDDAIERGVEIVRKLDAIMKNKYANNPAVLAEWLSASHTERAPRHKKSIDKSTASTEQPPSSSGEPPSAGGGSTPSE
jgi:hypothetical protein